MNEGTSHLDASYFAIGIENEKASFYLDASYSAIGI
jgi:hypothetical protein